MDPVQDDIEIVNDGEGTDAFAVRVIPLIPLTLCLNIMCICSLSSKCYLERSCSFVTAVMKKLLKKLLPLLCILF